MAELSDERAWQALWQRLDGLGAFAEALRRLSQEEPLVQARPDYPRAPRVRVSHADELRRTLEGIRRVVFDLQPLVAAALPDGERSAAVLPEDAPAAVDKRLGELARLCETLSIEAFEPLPPLPKHAPPYVLESPRHDLAGSKAVYLSYALEEIVASLRNALLSRANAAAAG